MKDDTELMPPVQEGLHNHASKNDGPDETPVYEDLFHDEGRRNILDEEAEDRPATMKK